MNFAEFLMAVAAGSLVTILPLPATLSAIAVVVVVGIGSLRAGRTSTAGRSPIKNAAALSLVVGFGLVTFNGVRIHEAMMLADAFLLVSAGLWFLMRIAEGQRGVVRVPGWLWAATGLLVTLGIFTSMQSENPATDLIVTAQFSVTMLMVPVLASQLLNDVNWMKTAAWVFVASASVNALIGTIDHVTGAQYAARITGFAPLGRSAGLTLHPNHLGRAASMALPFVLVLARRNHGLLRARQLIIVPLLGLGVLTSGSRAALGAAALALILPSVLNKRLDAPTFLIGCFSTMLLIALVAYSPAEAGLDVGVRRLIADPTVGVSDVARSNATRLELYREAITDFNERPLLGLGLGTVRQAHNIVLQLLQAGGLFGLTAFLIFVIGTLRTGLSLLRNISLDQESRAIALAAVASFLVWILPGLVQVALYDRYLYVPVGLLLAVRSVAIVSAPEVLQNDRSSVALATLGSEES